MEALLVMQKPLVAILVFVALAVTAGVWFVIGTARSPIAPTEVASASYVGANSCEGCHQTEFKAWKGSHHDQSMQHAKQETVLGDFKDATFEYNSVKTRFFKRNEEFFIHTDGADGKLEDFAVKYTFGVYPLQQYLLEGPGGRLQALSIAWDARPKTAGGQRWFHLYPGEKIDSRDELHWTKSSQNWNNMCSQCHSTNLKKGFDLSSNSFRTTWSEVNVSCESCHGAGARHVAWANKAGGTSELQNFGLENRLDERRGVNWDIAPSAKIASRSKERDSVREIETCARCHARRSELVETEQVSKPLMDTHLPSLLTSPHFHPDGQIKEEDFEYASFLQSKMFHKGVTCSDCHEPHSQKLRAPGSATCLTCHRSEYYANETHSHHKAGSAGSDCISCHMPTTNYMVVHARHDHSIRIPRPDLSLKLKTPNACNQCHLDKDPAWAAAQMKLWYGKGWSENWHFGETLFAANADRPDSSQELLALAMSPKLPDIARATAASMLPQHLDATVFIVLPQMLKDRSPMVRREALALLEIVPLDRRWELGAALLKDPLFAVRMEAGRVLAGVPRGALSDDERNILAGAIQEYIKAALASAESPQSHLNLGLLYFDQGEFAKTEAEYRQAIRLDPEFAGAYVNLADLYRDQQASDKVEHVLREGLGRLPKNAEIKHALGLYFVRQKQLSKALELLEEAARLRPDNIRFGYVYAVALFDSGEQENAVRRLSELAQNHPYAGDVLMALVSYHRALGQTDLAHKYAEQLLKNEPSLGSIEQIMHPPTQ